ncbi:MAG: glycosyltransferase [Rhodospirillales bacterium]|nr:glycosyltransferase [Rhodospirillales bacterium]
MPRDAAPAGVADAASWAGLDVLVLSPTPTAPLDAGNRRRIHAVNSALQAQGARVVFVHYPAEGDWRQDIPAMAQQAMQAQWSECYTVPVTRPLHEAARGEDHAIDEWWDPAIGEMLRWLFATHRFAAFIVNYAWLSKAFEFCPAGTLKVLDTHDRLSGRREVLARLNIAPEFFHTTAEEERIALARADIVWSIKPEEADWFRSLGARHVINVPHVELPRPAPPPRPDRTVLRFGIAGAANSINLRNVTAFLDAAVAYVEETLLPCEIAIAGGICDLLDGFDLPWIIRLGRLPDMAAFYAATDVILAPVACSTGLKIKVGEALALGKPVLALAHAFEGYVPQHDFHRLGSLPAMLAACHRIVNTPDLIAELAECSRAAARLAEAERQAGLAQTVSVLGSVPEGLCIVVAAARVFPGSPVFDHVLETAAYLGNLLPVTVFLDGPAEHGAEAGCLRRLAAFARIVPSPEAQAGIAPALARELGLRLLPRRPLQGVLRLNLVAVWFASRPAGGVPAGASLAMPAYIACDSVALGGGPAEVTALLAQARSCFPAAIAVARGPAVPDGATAVRRVPLLWRGTHSMIMSHLRDQAGDGVAVLADAAGDPLLGLTVALILRLSSRQVVVILPDHAAPAAIPCDDPARVCIRTVLHCFGPDPPAPALPMLAFDVSTDPALEPVREILDRAQVPLADLFTGRAGPADGVWREPAGAAGLEDSVDLIQRLLADPEAAAALLTARGRGRDYWHNAGWAMVWADLARLVATPPAAQARAA